MTDWTPKQVQDLTNRVNMKLRERRIETRDIFGIGPVVEEVAPGWDWRENDRLGDRWAKVRLTQYAPEVPL